MVIGIQRCIVNVFYCIQKKKNLISNVPISFVCEKTFIAINVWFLFVLGAAHHFGLIIVLLCCCLVAYNRNTSFAPNREDANNLKIMFLQNKNRS